MEKEGAKHLYGKTRYVILFLALLTMTFAYSNSLVFTFTVICMDDVQDDWIHSPTQVNALFSALAIGCLIGAIPISYFVQKWGIGVTCSVFGAISSISTLLFPFAINLGYPALFIARALQGIPTALPFVTMGQVSSQWSTEKSLGSFVAILSTYMQTCNIITMPVSGAMCTSPFGWRGAYYLHGILSMAVFTVFYLFYHDNPAKHRTVSEKELERISRGKKNLATDRRVPYGAILRDPCILTTWIAILGSTTSYQAFFLYGPTYLNKALGLDVRATGWSTAFPYFLALLVKLCMGWVSDSASFVSQRTRLIFFTTISQALTAICLIIISLTSSAVIAQIAYTAAVVSMAIVCVGTFKGASMVARQHVHFVMAVCSLIMVVITFLLPAAVAYVCPNNTPEEWARMFIFIAVFVMVMTTPYCFYARDQPAEWTLATPAQDKIYPFEKDEKKIEAA